MDQTSFTEGNTTQNTGYGADDSVRKYGGESGLKNPSSQAFQDTQGFGGESGLNDPSSQGTQGSQDYVRDTGAYDNKGGFGQDSIGQGNTDQDGQFKDDEMPTKTQDTSASHSKTEKEGKGVKGWLSSKLSGHKSDHKYDESQSVDAGHGGYGDVKSKSGDGGDFYNDPIGSTRDQSQSLNSSAPGGLAEGDAEQYGISSDTSVPSGPLSGGRRGEEE